MDYGKHDPYSEWALRPSGQGNAGSSPIVAELLRIAPIVWPRVLAHATRELSPKYSEREARAIAGEVWEGVQRSVSRALQRKGVPEWPDHDLEAYLFRAFHRRFNRVLKREGQQDARLELVSSTAELEQIRSVQDVDAAARLERDITLREIVALMDEWTKEVWESRLYGYSWREIAAKYEMTEAQAKNKFAYGLRQTRERVMQ